MNLYRWLFPSWRRFVRFTIGGLLAVGLIYWSRAWWLPLVAQWQYWHLIAQRERAGTATGPAWRNHPLSFELPALPMKLLEDGQWATESVKASLQTLRRAYPQEAAELDYYLAGWEFWSGDAYAAREECQRLGKPIDPVLFALRVNDRAALPRLANDPAVSAASRARAWEELARRAQREGRTKEAAAAYLEILEHAITSPQSPGTVNVAWEAVRVRLGQQISVAEYRAALRRMAQRTNEQVWLEQIMFELGKLKLLADEAGEKEAKNAKS